MARPHSIKRYKTTLFSKKSSGASSGERYFDKGHLLPMRPSWLWRFATAMRCATREGTIRFFCWKPKAANQPEAFFAVHVNARDAETTVTLARLQSVK